MKTKIDDTDDLEELDKAFLARKWHDDIVKGDKYVVNAINEQFSKIAKAIEKISVPDVNIEVNQEKVISSLYDIRDEIRNEITVSKNKFIEALDNRLLPDTFTLIRNGGGFTETVKVNYKPAKDIKK